jgi:type II secretory pathway component PulF
MPKYRYNATNSAGKWVSGEVDAPTHDDAVAQLRSTDLTVESLIEADDKQGSAQLSRSDLIELVGQLESLTRAGVPLPSGLRAAANEIISPALRSTFRDLANKMESGLKLEDALTSSGGRFPPELRGLILAGARSGKLTEFLSEFVRGANLGTELRRMFWTTLSYPAITLLVMLVMIRFICLIAVQSAANVFKDFGIDMPGSTRMLIGLSEVISDHGGELALGMIVVPLLIWGAFRLFNGPADRRRILCGIPLIGPILRYCSLTEFCHRLAMLLEAELPLPLAFELAGSSVGDAEVAEACHEMGQAVAGGQPLWQAVRLWDAIPAGLGELFQWSENQRSLSEALHLAGDMFEARARSQSSFTRTFLSTVLFFLIIWWVGFAVAALYLPMISLISRLSG